VIAAGTAEPSARPKRAKGTKGTATKRRKTAATTGLSSTAELVMSRTMDALHALEHTL